jgi:hypothetical protein
MKSQRLPSTLLTSLLLIMAAGSLNAQKTSMKFGKIEPEFFALQYYDKDTAAEALILGDYGESKIIYDTQVGFIVEYSRHFRAKIFKKSAYDLANQHLYLYHTATAQEKVVSLKGKVYNMENGKVVESDLEKEMIRDETIDNRRIERKFTLPNVREGSILEFTYVVRSDFMSMPDWRFQHTVPALWSECRVSYPEYFYFKKLQKGFLAFDVSEEFTKPVVITAMENEREDDGRVVKSNTSTYQIRYTDNCFRWVKNDVPAFREEPYMNALLNYLSAIEFELASYKPPSGMQHNYTTTWEKINEELLRDEDFGLQLNRGGFMKDKALKIKAAFSNPVEQMAAAHAYIRNTMKWDGRNRMYVTSSLKNAFDAAAGSSSDINLMLVAMLREMGIASDPVILSTRNNGIVHPAQIMVNQFNYVIASATIADKTYLLDATDKLCNHNMLPPRCINGEGRIISESKPGWIDINSAQRYEFTNMINVKIVNDGTFSGSMQRQFGNYAALEKRREVGGKKDHDEYVRDLETNFKGLAIDHFELLNLDSLHKPFKEVLKVEISDNALVAGNLISFTPLLFDQWIANPFKLEERKFPVDFTYPHVYKDLINYEIPEGYVLDEKPADMVIALADGKTKFTYRMAVTGNRLSISSVLEIGKSLYTYEEYEALKTFFNQVVSKQAERIVLKKAV